MQEPRSPKFNVHECQDESTKAFYRQTTAKLEAVHETRNSLIDSLSSVRRGDESADDFSLAMTANNDTQLMLAQTFVDEKQLLATVQQRIPELRDAARQSVSDRDEVSVQALARIRSEVQKFGLPFNNERQETYFLSRCEAFKPFKDSQDAARVYESSVNSLAVEIEKRVEWLTRKVTELQNKLLGPALA